MPTPDAAVAGLMGLREALPLIGALGAAIVNPQLALAARWLVPGTEYAGSFIAVAMVYAATIVVLSGCGGPRLVPVSGRVTLLKVDEIDFIEADGNYAKLHVGRKEHLLREKMHDLEGRLDPAKFVRIHRSVIVNLDRIKEMHPHFNGDYIVVLEDGQKLRLSRSRRENLQAKLKLNHG